MTAVLLMFGIASISFGLGIRYANRKYRALYRDFMELQQSALEMQANYKEFRDLFEQFKRDFGYTHDAEIVNIEDWKK